VDGMNISNKEVTLTGLLEVTQEEIQRVMIDGENMRIDFK